MKDSNRDGIKLSQLRALVAVAKHGNFSEAALQLDISQSAVSHAIASLEGELGVVLLSRGRQGARLTPVGERITAHATEMLQLLDCISKEANLAKGLNGGEVRIACFRSVATHVLPEIIAEFRRIYPAIAVTIQEYRGDEGGYEVAEQSVRTGRSDIGFTCLSPGAEFESLEVMSDEYYVLFPPTYDVPPGPLTWEQILEYPLILPPDDDACAHLIHTHFAKFTKAIVPTYRIREDSTIIGMVMKGLGITIMAQLAAEPLPSAIQVRPLPVALERKIYTIIRSNALHSPAVFAFLDLLKRMDRFISPRSKLLRAASHRKTA
jgi:DNA-binding transcriptional LysR family regulator